MTTIEQLVIETWVEYSIATVIVLLRYYVRLRMVGIRNLDYDDYIMPIAWLFFTAMSIMAHIVSQSGDNANMSEEYRKNISAQEAATRILGSKAFIVGWFTYTGMLWTLKMCVLAFLRRITSGLGSAKLILPVLYLVLVSWVVNIVLFVSSCRPFYKYWQIYPDPGKYCTPENPNFFITVLAINLVTDLCIVVIPIPMLLQAQLPTLRKVMLFLVLCAGVFVMIAAILRVVFVFKNGDPATPAIWACRETLVAMLVANLPILRPLFSARWWRGDYSKSSKQRSYPAGSHSGHIELGSQKDTSAHFYSVSRKEQDDHSSSTEHIVQPPGGRGIRIQTQIEVVSQ